MSRQRWYHALAGAVAGLAGIAVAQLATGVLDIRATPVQAVAEWVIVHTPGPVAEALIKVVERKDKPLLVGGVTVTIVLLGALAGVLARRTRLGANLVLLGMGAVALAAELAQPGFGSAQVVPLAAGVATWLVVLAVLVDAVPAPTETGRVPGEEPVAAGPGRRRFLLYAGGVTVVSVAAASGAQLFGRTRRAVEASRSRLRLPVRRGTAPANADLGLPGMTPWRVPNGAFYRIDTALVPPAVDPGAWRLRIHGMVDRELTLTFQDLLDRRLTEAWVTLCCVSNPVGGDLVGNAFWSGVRVADLLAEAGVSPGADAVKQTSHDGWTCGTPLAALTDGRNAMLAVAMNGAPLPIAHGFPVRMVVPGLYGFVSATKWVVDLEVTRFEAFTAYWTQRGWSAQGPVKTESRIEVPGDGADVKAGPMRVGGYAWAQHTGIERVEVRLDGGPWRRADLGGVPNDDTWVQWAAALDVPPGEHTLMVRATDRSGYTQTPVRRDVVPDGATGWHTISFTAG